MLTFTFNFRPSIYQYDPMDSTVSSIDELVAKVPNIEKDYPLFLSLINGKTDVTTMEHSIKLIPYF